MGTYRWIRMFGIQAKEGESLYPGEVVTVENANGETKDVMVEVTWEYVTKGGKTLTRAMVKDV